MRSFWKVPAVFLLVILLVMPSAVLAQTTDFSPLSGVGAAISKGDVEAALSFFADDAIISEAPPFTIKGVSTFTGKQQIRQWLQKNIDGHAVGTAVGTPKVEGNKLTGIEQAKSDDLKKAGIDSVTKNVEFVVTGGKIKSATYTVSPESVVKLKQAGIIADVTTQGQGGAAPTGAPATGFGQTPPGTDWLTLPVILAGLFTLSGVSQWLMRRRFRR